MRQKWITKTVSDQAVPLGQRASVYAFKIAGGGASQAEFRTGGPTGNVLNLVSTSAANTTFVDRLDGNGGWIEFPDGVYITMTGTATAGILVQTTTD